MDYGQNKINDCMMNIGNDNQIDSCNEYNYEELLL